MGKKIGRVTSWGYTDKCKCDLQFGNTTCTFIGLTKEHQIYLSRCYLQTFFFIYFFSNENAIKLNLFTKKYLSLKRILNTINNNNKIYLKIHEVQRPKEKTKPSFYKSGKTGGKVKERKSKK